MTGLSAHEFFIAGFSSSTLKSSEIALLKCGLSGVIHFKRNIESLDQVVALNQAIIEAHAMCIISVDQEGGRVARLREICSDIPPMLSLTSAFKEEEKLCYRIGALQGRELLALGFNLNFAPVCDILSNDKNQVIGDRAFSYTANEVARFSSLYIKGLQGSGIAACAKHFPGHGDTLADSHESLPIVTTGIEELFNRELVPFKEAINNNVASIMTAHIVVEKLDHMPATMSEKILSRLLRNDLGYKNLIISDDLDMKAVADSYDLKEILEYSVMAGVDMFIIGNNLEKTTEAIAILDELKEKNSLIKEKLYRAQKRIAALRARYIGTPKAPDLNTAKNIVRCKPHLKFADTLTKA